MKTPKRTATIGTFDGCHRGHRLVFQALKEEAARDGLTPTVITFDRHPLQVVAPQRAPKRLTLPEREQEMIRREGLDVMVEPFDESVMSLTAREWLRQMRDRHGVVTLIMGYDNTFGSDGLQKSIADYSAIAAEEGIRVVEAPLERGLSSSAIRRIIAEGDVATAAEMLGRPYGFEGHVVAGDAIGRTLGYPTANLEPDPWQLIPKKGVYAATATLADGSSYPAVVNVGSRPTVGDKGSDRIEAHLVGFDGDLYGQTLEISFLRRLRDEKRFDSFADLKAQIAADIRQLKP